MEKGRKILSLLIIIGTSFFGVSSYFDGEIDKINNQIFAHERNVLFETNRFLIGGLFYYFDNETFRGYSNVTLNVESLGRNMNYEEGINYLISKEINFRGDLIDVNAFYPQRDRMINKKLLFFWLGLMSMTFAFLINYNLPMKK